MGVVLTWFIPFVTTTVFVAEDQFVVARFVFCWRVKPGEGAGHEITAVLPLVMEIVRVGGLAET